MLTINLPKIVKENHPRKKRLTLRPFEVTISLESDLYAVYRGVVEEWREFIASVLLPAYELPPAPVVSDADGEQIQWLIDQKNADINSRIIYQTETLGRWVTRFGEWHTRRMTATAYSASGVEVETYLRMGDIRLELEAAIRQNVSMMQALSSDTKKSVEQTIFEGFALRKTKAQITRELADAMNVSQRRARVIAGDQAHKLNSVLTGVRQRQLGFNSYVWRTRRDDRVRSLHRAREGERFLWSSPPSDGHPGWPINCRCIAEAYAEL